jgi:ActR/RegA family two-component response regulator
VKVVLPSDLFAKVVSDESDKTPVFGIDTFVPLKDLAFQYVKTVVAESGHNKTRAAKTLGIDRRTLYRILDRGRVGNVSKY